jgi:hypothetical protein
MREAQARVHDGKSRYDVMKRSPAITYTVEWTLNKPVSSWLPGLDKTAK